VEAIAVFALALAYFALFVRYGFNLDDEGTLLAQFYRTYLGQIPYRDFHMGYTPAGHQLQARLFDLFGVSVVPLRAALAVCHATCATLLFVIGRRIMPAAFAVLPPLAYVAMMPFYPGEFASFNIPYPSWYVTLFWLAGLWVLLRFLENGGLGWVALSGAFTALCFAFKPNVGLFQLASAGLVFLIALEPPLGERPARLESAAWWLLACGVPAGLAVVFSSQASGRDVRIFLLPVFALIGALVARRLARRSSDAVPRSLVAASVTLGLAVVVVVLPWVLRFLSLLGTQRFARQILFIGTGFEQYYYSPFHGAGVWDEGLVVALAGLVALGLMVRARRVPAWLLAVFVVLGGVAGAIALRHAPMPEGAHAALVSRLEDLSFGATLVVQWSALAAAMPVLWRRTRGRARAGPGRPESPCGAELGWRSGMASARGARARPCSREPRDGTRAALEGDARHRSFHPGQHGTRRGDLSVSRDRDALLSLRPAERHAPRLLLSRLARPRGRGGGGLDAAACAAAPRRGAARAPVVFLASAGLLLRAARIHRRKLSTRAALWPVRDPRPERRAGERAARRAGYARCRAGVARGSLSSPARRRRG
jgi:hypothetical protein